jgi:hypothetical protein
LGTEITVVTLVDDECVLGDGRGINIVGVEEVDEFGCGGRSGFGGRETEIVSGGPGCSLYISLESK